MTAKVSSSFRPPVFITLVLLMLVSLFASLGVWQTRRAAEKLVIEQQHQAAATVSLKDALNSDQRFAQVSAVGHYDPVRHILLDNQIWQGRAGVHVFTPFHTLAGTVILVNRGWLPLAADRLSLPEIPTQPNETVVRGMLNFPPVPGRLIGASDQLAPDQWPQLVTYMDIGDIARSLDLPLENRVIQLASREPGGFEGRDWKPVFITSTRHKAYAFQWFALTAACIVLWLVSGFRNPPGNSK